ncbi:MAG: hypothetical protein COT84_03225 [Chlamydiae bacterium CG10_big_fil_rev_8_21_14_0_10_35_9]|nr:MAG: hypothetical protein COT84_03225 [Chlamydiae bacterium CG10_big_fil_rev_8_21_14_0_10_35_9]
MASSIPSSVPQIQLHVSGSNCCNSGDVVVVDQTNLKATSQSWCLCFPYFQRKALQKNEETIVHFEQLLNEFYGVQASIEAQTNAGCLLEQKKIDKEPLFVDEFERIVAEAMKIYQEQSPGVCN